MQLRTKLVSLVMLTWLLSASVMFALLAYNENKYVQEELSNRAVAVTKIAVSAPFLQEWMTHPEAEQENIQRFAERLRTEASVDFVVVMTTDGIRMSHPNPDNIGKHFRGGDEVKALHGESYVSIAQGTMGESVRAFAPIYYQGKEVGVVATGVSMNAVEAAIKKRNMQMLGGGIAVLCVGLVLTLGVSRKIKSTLLNMEPQDLARLTVERNTVIQSVCEGVIVIDKKGILQVVNDEARRIFAKAGITGDLLGQQSMDVIPHTRMMDIVRSGKKQLNQEQRLNSVVILTNRVPLVVNGEIVGAIATFRDFQEVWELSEEVTGLKNYVEALRVRAYEYRNTLHVINGLVANREYDKLQEYIQSLSLTSETEFAAMSKQVKDPVILSFLQSKQSRSRELNVHLVFHPDMTIPVVRDPEFRNSLITIMGNLIDNAMEAVQLTQTKIVRLHVYQRDGWYIEVSDTGTGLPANVRQIFKKGYSTKGENRGFGLFILAKAVQRYNGKLNVQPNEPEGTIFTVFLRGN